MSLEDIVGNMILDSTDDAKIINFASTSFELAKNHKKPRESKVEENMYYLKEINYLTGRLDHFHNQSGKKSVNSRNEAFYSSVLVTTVEKKSASAWIPQITFEPEEMKGDGDDTYTARNVGRVHDFMLRTGKFYEQKPILSLDLFTAGRCFLYKGWQTKKDNNDFEKAQYMKFKALRWRKVFWTKDKHTYFACEEYSPNELIYEFGEEIMGKNITDGNPFDSKNYSGEPLDCNNKGQRIGVVMVFNDVQKIFAIIIGGNKFVFLKHTKDKYPWLNEKDEGFIPIDTFDDSDVMTCGNDHPVSDLDKIINIWISYSITMNTSIQRLEQSARSRRIIGVEGNAEEERQKWVQSEVDFANGLDVPYFMKMNGTGASRLFAQQLEFNPQLQSIMSFRDMFYDEIMIAIGINYRALGQGAPTAEQERLRAERELEVIEELIRINEPNWQKFANGNIQMLKNVDAEFVEEHVMIEDEFTDAPNSFGSKAEGKVKDIVDELEDFPFNVKVSINNSIGKRKSVERFQKQEALRLLSETIGPTQATAKIAKDLASDLFPNLIFDDEEFQSAPTPEQGLEAQAAQLGAIPAA